MKKILVQLLLVLIVSNVNAQEWSKELEKRAKKGDIEAVVEVGNAYFKGNGVKRDLEKAAKWYYEAIQRGKDEVKENFFGGSGSSFLKFFVKEEKLKEEDIQELLDMINQSND